MRNDTCVPIACCLIIGRNAGTGGAPEGFTGPRRFFEQNQYSEFQGG